MAQSITPTPQANRPLLRVVRDEESPTYDGDWRVTRVELEPKRVSTVMVTADVGRTILGTLGPSAFAVYWHLTMRSKDGQCWPSLDDIADGTTLSRMHVTRMLNALEEGGWITRQKRTNEFGFSTSTLYTIIEKQRTDGCNIVVTSREHEGTVDVTRTSSELVVNKNVVNTLAPSPKTESRKRTAYTDEFETFWVGYPRGHGTKGKAFAEWQKLTAEDRQAAIVGLDAWKSSRRWQEGFIKDADGYLKWRFWDNPPESSRPASTSVNGRYVDKGGIMKVAL